MTRQNASCLFCSFSARAKLIAANCNYGKQLKKKMILVSLVAPKGKEGLR
jgi:hypothetical protein